ncbi:hypothetical protein WR25_05421 [Diploscapter pachys]|uniref:Uncharacterized protein n=1 Tax=Diploscapter pachys TaxID=2018661 RepID=A0A2A2K7V0_9BILA|nr:hypothetical protein WR25_05421 [Diploscapter pachys]
MSNERSPRFDCSITIGTRPAWVCCKPRPARPRCRRTSRRPRTTVSRISPAKPHSAAMIISPVMRTAVGKRGTRCVCMYVIASGTPSTTATAANSAPIAPKNSNGRSIR